MKRGGAVDGPLARTSDVRRLPALDLLRAAALTWVVLYHLAFRIRAWSGARALPDALWTALDYGHAGVDLFFVLSGFLIGRILHRELATYSTIRLGMFWYRRWMRTLPAYAATLVVVSVVALRREPTSSKVIVMHALFLQNYFHPTDTFRWSWSLCVEEHFYLFLPVVLVLATRLFSSRSPALVMRAIAVVLLFCSVAWRWRYWSFGNNDERLYWNAVYSITHARLDGLVAGVFLATLPRYTLGVCAGSALAALGCALVFACVVKHDSPWVGRHAVGSFSLLAIGFACVVASLLGRPTWMASSLPGAKVASEISYSLYLVHPLVFSVTFERLRLLGVTGVTATSLVLSVALAWGMRRAIEMPLLRVRDRETFGGIGLSPGGANGNEAIVRSVPRRP